MLTLCEWCKSIFCALWVASPLTNASSLASACIVSLLWKLCMDTGSNPGLRFSLYNLKYVHNITDQSKLPMLLLVYYIPCRTYRSGNKQNNLHFLFCKTRVLCTIDSLSQHFMFPKYKSHGIWGKPFRKWKLYDFIEYSHTISSLPHHLPSPHQSDPACNPLQLITAQLHDHIEDHYRCEVQSRVLSSRTIKKPIRIIVICYRQTTDEYDNVMNAKRQFKNSTSPFLSQMNL